MVAEAFAREKVRTTVDGYEVEISQPVLSLVTESDMDRQTPHVASLRRYLDSPKATWRELMVQFPDYEARVEAAIQEMSAKLVPIRTSVLHQLVNRVLSRYPLSVSEKQELVQLFCFALQKYPEDMVVSGCYSLLRYQGHCNVPMIDDVLSTVDPLFRKRRALLAALRYIQKRARREVLHQECALFGLAG